MCGRITVTITDERGAKLIPAQTTDGFRQSLPAACFDWGVVNQFSIAGALNLLILHHRGYEVRLNLETYRDHKYPGSDLVRGLRPIKSNQGLQASALRILTTTQVWR